jgi:hypothetical protein
MNVAATVVWTGLDFQIGVLQTQELLYALTFHVRIVRCYFGQKGIRRILHSVRKGVLEMIWEGRIASRKFDLETCRTFCGARFCQRRKVI